LARQLLERLHGDGWAVVAVVGRWYPLGLFDAVTEGLHASAGGYTAQCQPMLETLVGSAPDGRKFEAVCQLLERFPLALLFDDLGLNLGAEGFLDPGFGEAFDRLCRATGRGRVLVTSRELPPMTDRGRFRRLRLGPLNTAAGLELAGNLPFLSTMDEPARERLVTAVEAHPRSLQLIDAWLAASKQRPDERITALASGVAPVELIWSQLAPPERDTLLQAAVLTLPVTADQLATACESRNSKASRKQKLKRRTRDAVASSADRLTRLGLLESWTTEDGNTVFRTDRWIAEQLAPHQGETLTDRHEGAINMHFAQTQDAGGRLDQYFAMSRHLVAVQGMGDLTKLVLDVTNILGFSDTTFTSAALLGETAPSVPGGNGHHQPIVERLTALLLHEGFSQAACEVTTRSLRAVNTWAPTHPKPDERRFMLAAAHDRHGMVLLFDDQLAEAQATLTTAVDILHELAAEHPTFLEGHRRLADTLDRLAEVYQRLDLPQHEDKRYETAAECVHLRTQLFQADPGPETALNASPAFQRLAGLADRAGNPEVARTLLGTRHAMVEAMAAAHPYDEELAAELASAAGDLVTRDAKSHG
jgi:hypothetical protein